MTDATQPRTGRGTMLPVVGVLAAALFALLAFAPFASAASDPLGSGTTTIKLNKGFAKSLKKNGVKVLKVSPGKVKGTTVTLPVSGGSLDPTTGQGTVDNSGGFKFKAGKKNVALKNLVLDTTKKSLSGKLGKKNLKIASVAGLSFTREGFGTNVKIGKLKLTGKAAKELNAKLGLSGKSGTKKSKRASTSKSSSNGVFKANQVLGGSTSATQPSEVAVLPGGNVTFAANATTLGKLLKVKVKVEPIAPTASPTAGLYNFPITGGTISPTATGGVVQSAGGLKLVQKLQTGAESFITTNITLGAFWVDLAGKTATVEVVAESDASKELNLGNLGRSSIADITVTGVTADPVTRTVSVNASATLQMISASVLDGFVKVYEGYEKLGGEPVSPEHINSGEPLGTFSFTAQTQ
jgi:hypothetical protein